MTTRTSMPRACSALGSAPATSARPPVFAKGAHSEATKRTLSGVWLASAPTSTPATPATASLASRGLGRTPRIRVAEPRCARSSVAGERIALGGGFFAGFFAGGFGTRSARVDAVVDVREDVVARLDVGEPALVDLGRPDVVIELVELQDVLVDAPRGVRHGRAGLHDEGPVGGLREHELAGRLVERALRERIRRGMAPRELHHALARDVQVTIRPGVRLVEPVLVVTARAPRRRARRRHLVRRVTLEVVARRERLDGVLVEVKLTEQVVEKDRAFVPPVPEELGVVRAHDHGRPIHLGAQPPRLLLAVAAEVRGVQPRLAARDLRVVDPLVVELVVSDGVVLDARVDAMPLGVDVRLDVVERQVEADVAIEVAVMLVARVALLGAPHLLRRLEIAPERRDAARAVDRRIDAVSGPVIGEQDAVRVDEEVPDRGLAQQLVDAGHVAALAEPHAARAVAEVVLIEIGRDVDLGADVRPVAIHEREERVRRRRRDDLDAPRGLQPLESAHEIAVVRAPGVAQATKPVVIHVREAVVVRLGLGALDLLFTELDELVEVLRVPDLEEVVGQHRDERRRQRDRAAVRDLVADEAVEDLHERQVRARDGLVEPLLFHDRRILGVTDEREMGVQDEREVAGRHQDWRSGPVLGQTPPDEASSDDAADAGAAGTFWLEPRWPGTRRSLAPPSRRSEPPTNRRSLAPLNIRSLAPRNIRSLAPIM